ncbi:hypothetical protein ACFU9B_31045 [Streptomyces sp. NPDC057592]|uniref:hypothetical protein n=1 Tax=unclassified Streptomyces TaxID=2593676 RepID=UPI0036759E29
MRCLPCAYPLLYGEEPFTPEPLRVHPPPEVLALDDDVARGRRERAAGLDAVLDDEVAALPPGALCRAPARTDRIQLILCRAAVIAPAAEGTGRQAACSSTFSRALCAAARAFIDHTPIGCTVGSSVAVVLTPATAASAQVLAVGVQTRFGVIGPELRALVGAADRCRSGTRASRCTRTS